MAPHARLLALVATFSLVVGPTAGAADPFGSPDTLPPSVPAGYAITVGTIAPAPTSLSFSPDGTTLYVASAAGVVLAYPVAAGVVAGPPIPFATGLNLPLGVLATDDAVFISDSVPGTRTEGIVLRARDTTGDVRADEVETVIDGLPNGRHNTNGLALGPDGMLYIANGNSTDSGFGSEGGPPEVRPFSGSVLRVDPEATDLTPDPSMVVATGWRNIYDLAFIPDGHPADPGDGVALAVPTNGTDGLTYGGTQRPPGEDTLAIFTVGGKVEHFRFPWCLYDRDDGGLDGFVQDPVDHPTPSGDCTTLPPEAFEGLDPDNVRIASPAALFGLHVSANGLAFGPSGDLFVTEFGSNNPGDAAGHKVVRVRFTADGRVEAVEDFMTGVVPLDLTFGPDGAMWVADVAGPITRIQAVV